jgi:hypothetical protein
MQMSDLVTLIAVIGGGAVLALLYQVIYLALMQSVSQGVSIAASLLVLQE